MLTAKNFISYNYYLWAKSKGVHIFLYNEIDFIPDEVKSSGEIFYNCTANRVESTWYTWKENDTVIQAFKSKFPQFFQINGYDLTLAIQKAMYWANLKSGFLWYSISEFFPNEKIFFAESLHVSGKLGSIKRYLKLLRFNSSSNNNHSNGLNKPGRKFAIHLKSDFQLGFYIELIEKIKHDELFQIVIEPGVNEKYLNELGISEFEKIEYTKDSPSVPMINPLKFTKNDSFTFNIILMHWDEIFKYIQTAESMLSPNLKAVLINEGENGIYGAMVSEVFAKNKVKVYNTMNGVKSGEAQDAYINIDFWFVWDEQMKNMLSNNNSIPKEKLIVSGHLIEDLIQNYQNHHSLSVTEEKLKSRKVVSVFTVKGKRVVKLESFKFLYNLLDEDESIELFIRPHPAEKPEDFILPEKNQDRVHFATYNSKNLNSSLHDLLLVSDLAIVFGSTVALDAKWMGVPCLTFEMREKSMIYCIDDEHIQHAKTIEKFESLVRQNLKKKTIKLEENKRSVSDFVLNELKNNN